MSEASVQSHKEHAGAGAVHRIKEFFRRRYDNKKEKYMKQYDAVARRLPGKPGEAAQKVRPVIEKASQLSAGFRTFYLEPMMVTSAVVATGGIALKTVMTKGEFLKDLVDKLNIKKMPGSLKEAIRPSPQRPLEEIKPDEHMVHESDGQAVSKVQTENEMLARIPEFNSYDDFGTINLSDLELPDILAINRWQPNGSKPTFDELNTCRLKVNKADPLEAIKFADEMLQVAGNHIPTADTAALILEEALGRASGADAEMLASISSGKVIPDKVMRQFAKNLNFVLDYSKNGDYLWHLLKRMMERQNRTEEGYMVRNVMGFFQFLVPLKTH